MNLCRSIILASPCVAPSASVGVAYDVRKDDEIGEDSQFTIKAQNTAKNLFSSFAPRSRTKIFCMKCIQRIVSICQSIRDHIDMESARKKLNLLRSKNLNADLLVLHLEDLISIVFQAANHAFDGLRLAGTQVLRDIINTFGEVMDPDFEGHKLLEVYEVQIGGALRPSFAADALPLVTEEACQVAVDYMAANIIILNSSSLKKLLSNLTGNIIFLREKSNFAYSERANAAVRLAILSSLARLYLQTKKSKSLEKIGDMLNLYLPLLKSHWLALLRDLAVLTTHEKDEDIQRAYKGQIISFSTTSNIDIHSLLINILNATSSLIHSPYWDIRSVESYKETVGSLAELAPEGEVDEKKIGSLLSESDDMQDAHLICGFCLRNLSSAHNLNSPVAQSHLSILLLLLRRFGSKFDLDILKEILNGVAMMAKKGLISIKLECVKLFKNFLQSLDKSFFDESRPQTEDLFQESVEVYLFCLYHVIPSLTLTNPSNEQPKAITAEVMEMIKEVLIGLGELFHLMPDRKFTLYSSVILSIYLKLILLAGKMQLISLLSYPVEGVKSFLKIISTDDHLASQVNLLLAASLASALNLIEEDRFAALSGQEGQYFLTLFSSLFLVSIKKGVKLDAIEKKIFSFYQRALSSSNAKVRMEAMATVRSVIQLAMSISPEETDPGQLKIRYAAYQIIQSVGPDLVLVLKLENKKKEWNTDSLFARDEKLTEEEVSEVMRFLVLVHSFVDDNQKKDIFIVLLPTLIFLLKWESKVIQDSALAVVLRLANTFRDDFRQVVSQLSTDQRTLLEGSIRSSMEKSTAVVVQKEEKKTSAPLKLDFSKYA